jgi:hypothetical protein
VGEAGLKAVVMAAYARRPLPELAAKSPEASPYAYWLDNFCVDSEYDYDPVWDKCVQLGVAPTFHSSGMAWAAPPLDAVIDLSNFRPFVTEMVNEGKRRILVNESCGRYV